MTVKPMIKRDTGPQLEKEHGVQVDNVTERERWTLGQRVSEGPREGDLLCSPRSCSQSPPRLMLTFFWKSASQVVYLLAFEFYY